MKGVSGTGPFSRVVREGLSASRHCRCSECGVEFTYFRTGRPRLTCGDTCRYTRIRRMARVYPASPCPICGRQTSPGQVGRPPTYCNPSCRSEGKWRRLHPGYVAVTR